MKKKIILTLAIPFLISYSSRAQGPQISASPLSINIDGVGLSNIPGSPLLFKEWNKADVIIAPTKIYKDIKINYNIISNTLIFFDESEQKAKAFSEPVKKFIINSDGGRKSTFIKEQKGYDELLVTGKKSLFKQYSKSIVEERMDNTIIPVKHIKTTINYYISIDGLKQPIKLSKKNLYAVVSDKETEMKEFSQKEKLNLSKEDDVISFMKHYNEL